MDKTQSQRKSRKPRHYDKQPTLTKISPQGQWRKLENDNVFSWNDTIDRDFLSVRHANHTR